MSYIPCTQQDRKQCSCCLSTYIALLLLTPHLSWLSMCITVGGCCDTHMIRHKAQKFCFCIEASVLSTQAKELQLALRSGVHNSVAWALNALTVLSFDSANPLLLSHHPGLLDALLEVRPCLQPPGNIISAACCQHDAVIALL